MMLNSNLSNFVVTLYLPKINYLITSFVVYFKLFVTPGTLYCFYKFSRIKRKKSKSHISDYFSYLRLSQIIVVLQYGFSLIEFQTRSD